MNRAEHLLWALSVDQLRSLKHALKKLKPEDRDEHTAELVKLMDEAEATYKNGGPVRRPQACCGEIHYDGDACNLCGAPFGE